MNSWQFTYFVFSLFYLLCKTFFVDSWWSQLNCLFVIWQSGLPTSQIVKYSNRSKIIFWIDRFSSFLETYLSPVTATKSELGSNSICLMELSKISEITEKLFLSFTSKTVNLFWWERPTTILSVEIANFAGALKNILTTGPYSKKSLTQMYFWMKTTELEFAY